MDSIIQDISYYDITDYIVIINNIGIFVYDYALNIIFKKNIFNINRFKYKRDDYIAYTTQFQQNTISFLYKDKDKMSKEIYFVDPIDKFIIFDDLNTIFASDVDNIYIYKNDMFVKKIKIHPKSEFEVVKLLDYFLLVYKCDDNTLVFSKIHFQNEYEIRQTHTSIVPHKSNVFKFKVSRNGKYCLTVSKKGTLLRIYSIDTSLLVSEYRISYISCDINSINISKNNKWAIVNYNGNYIKAYNIETNTILTSYFTQGYYAYLYIEDVNIKIGFDADDDNCFYMVTDTGKLIKVLIKVDACEIVDIKRFMDNNFNDMIRMNLSFNYD